VWSPRSRRGSMPQRNPDLAIQTHFADLKDPRLDRTRLHDLMDILVIAICAVIDRLGGRLLSLFERGDGIPIDCWDQSNKFDQLPGCVTPEPQQSDHGYHRRHFGHVSPGRSGRAAPGVAQRTVGHDQPRRGKNHERSGNYCLAVAGRVRWRKGRRQRGGISPHRVRSNRNGRRRCVCHQLLKRSRVLQLPLRGSQLHML
jgi:hypothetical protein